MTIKKKSRENNVIFYTDEDGNTRFKNIDCINIKWYNKYVMFKYEFLER